MTATTNSLIGILLNEQIDSPMRIYEITERGLPLSSVQVFFNAVPLACSNIALVDLIGMTERTFNRRVKANPQLLLNSTHSVFIVRFAQTLEKAEEVFGERDKALRWLTDRAIGLDGKVPFKMLKNPIGYDLVETYLGRLEFNIY